jgi:hypothetical protein
MRQFLGTILSLLFFGAIAESVNLATSGFYPYAIAISLLSILLFVGSLVVRID